MAITSHMKLKIEPMKYYCSLNTFVINGIEGDYEDFGTKYDHSPETAKPYGCGNMKFDSKPATQEVLDKYKITLDDYSVVCDELSDALNFGNCNACV